ncbi:MAG: N-6 DNA methylase, partial [Miltoncostaeaceae bacterium]
MSTDHAPQTPSGDLLSVSEIAERAGVRPSAVSNWRRRHTGPDGFPSPAGRSPAGLDLFPAAAVEEWARAHGRAFAPAPPGVDLWRAVQAAVTTTDRDLDLVVEVALSLLAAPGVEAGADDEFSPLHARVRELASREDRAQAGEYILAARRRAQRRSADFETDPEIGRLMVDLAEPLNGVVLDTCAGLGGLLCEAARRLSTGAAVMLAGAERDTWAMGVAELRLALHGSAARLRTTDALRDPSLPGSADIVLGDIPKGQKLAPGDIDPADPRWSVGHPGTSGDMAWLQHAVACARPGGRAVVLAPQGTLHRTGRAAEIRAELLRRGLVRAVIALPAGSAGRTARVPMAIW